MVTKCDCKRDRLFVPFPFEEMKYIFFSFLHSGVDKRQSAALSSVTQHAMPAEFGGKWGTECLNIRFSACSLFYVCSDDDIA